MVQQRRTTRAHSEDKPDENEDQAEPGDDRVLTDNVAKDGVTHVKGTALKDLPDDLRAHILANPGLYAEPENRDDDDNG